MSIKHHIRVLHDTALHHAHTILGVVHDHTHVASNRHLVHHDHAHELVKNGQAEWVGITPAAAPTHEHHEHAEVAAEGIAALGATGGI